MQNTWGLYPWFVEHGEDLIHPIDIDNFKKESVHCKVFECVAEQKDYITIRYADRYYRVKSDLYEAIPIPKFNFGERVTIEGKTNDASIGDIIWHYTRKEPYYILLVNGKKKSKRYFGSELSHRDVPQRMEDSPGKQN